MNFHKFQPLFPLFKRLGTHTSSDAFYNEAWHLAARRNDPTSGHRFIAEKLWMKDREKFEQTLDPKFVAKAHRRGKKGWNVGASIEVIPHIRRPHPALVWYGPKKSLCKIIMRKGSIVHRETVERIPTGRENSVDGSRQI